MLFSSCFASHITLSPVRRSYRPIAEMGHYYDSEDVVSRVRTVIRSHFGKTWNSERRKQVGELRQFTEMRISMTYWIADDDCEHEHITHTHTEICVEPMGNYMFLVECTCSSIRGMD